MPYLVAGASVLSEELIVKGITPIIFFPDYSFAGQEGGFQEETTTHPLNMMQEMHACKRIRAASDQIFCTVHVRDVVESVIQLREVGAKCLFQICGNETKSRLDLARKAAAALNIDEKLIESIPLDDLGDSFKRPMNTSMRNLKLLDATGAKMKSLLSSIDDLAKQYKRE